MPRGRKPAAAPPTPAEPPPHPVAAWAAEHNITLPQFIAAAIEYGALMPEEGERIAKWDDIPAETVEWWHPSQAALLAAFANTESGT